MRIHVWFKVEDKMALVIGNRYWIYKLNSQFTLETISTPYMITDLKQDVYKKTYIEPLQVATLSFHFCRLTVMKSWALTFLICILFFLSVSYSLEYVGEAEHFVF